MPELGRIVEVHLSDDWKVAGCAIDVNDAWIIWNQLMGAL